MQIGVTIFGLAIAASTVCLADETKLEKAENRCSEVFGSMPSMQFASQGIHRRQDLTERAREVVTKYFYSFYWEWARRNPMPAGGERETWAAWEQSLEAPFESLRSILQQRWHEVVVHFIPPKMIEMNSGAYEAVGFLGAGREAAVFVVQNGKREEAIKVFDNFWSKPFWRNSSGHEALIQAGAPAAAILERDEDHEILRVEFVKGFAEQHVGELHNRRLISNDEFLAYNYFGWIERTLLTEKYGPLFKGHELPLNLNSDNVLYEPWQNRWIIVDPH